MTAIETTLVADRPAATGRPGRADALVAAVVSIVCTVVSFAAMAVVDGGGDERFAAWVAPLIIYGQGLWFATQVAIAGWVVGVPRDVRRVPWLPMTFGQPAILLGSLLIAAPLSGRTSDALVGVATWIAAALSLALTVNVARRRSGRWSYTCVAWMVLATLAWALVYATDVLPKWALGDRGYPAMAGAWQVPFSAAYVWWVWPRRST